MPIIVASSNVFRRELSSYLLIEAGYTVYEASDSTTLIECLDDVEPELVILDHWLNGAVEADPVQQVRQTCSAPILALTTRAFDAAGSVPFATPTDDLLIWPYQSDELLSRVASLHRHRHSAPRRDQQRPWSFSDHADIPGTRIEATNRLQYAEPARPDFD
jgi:two-component system, OmpR family, response regulator